MRAVRHFVTSSSTVPVRRRARTLLVAIAPCFAVAMSLVALQRTAAAADVTFQPSSGSWNTGTNWSTGGLPEPSDIAVIGATGGNGEITLDLNQSVSGLSITKTGSTVIWGNTSTLDSVRTLTLGTNGIVIGPEAGVVFIGGTDNAVASGTYQQVGLSLNGSQTWTNNFVTNWVSGSSNPGPASLFLGLTPSTVVHDFGAQTLTVSGSGWTELRGRFSGSGRILMDGTSGVLAIGSTAGALFTGGVEVRNGSLGIGNGSAVLGTGTLTIAGGQIFPYLSTRTIGNNMIWSGDFAMRDPRLALGASGTSQDALLITGSALLTGNRTVTVDNGVQSSGTSAYFAVGAVGDGGNAYSLTKAGPGTLVLLGDNTYSGGTIVSSGTLQVGGSGTTGSVVGNVALSAAGSTLVFDRSNALLYAGTISGSGSVVKNGVGGLTLTGTNTYEGTLTVNAGAVGINSVAALPGWDTSGRYSIGAGGAITFGNTVTGTQISTILGTGNVNAAAGTGFDTTDGNRTFSDNLATTFPSRNVFKTGPNSLIVDGQSTNTTSFTIAGGNVQVASAQTGTTSGPLGVGGSIVFAGGTLQYSSANNVDYSPRFTAGTQTYAADTNGQNVTWSRTFSLGSGGGISKSGAGLLTLSGGTVTMANSTIAVSGGTLAMGGISIPSSTGVVLDVTGGGRLEVTGTVAGSGSPPLTLRGDGQIIFTGSIANMGNGQMTVTGGADVTFPSGHTNLNRGQLVIDHGAVTGTRLRLQGSSSSFGNPNDNATRQVIRMGNATTSGTLRINASDSDTSNRQIQIGSGVGGGGAAIEKNGSGVLTLTGSAGWLNVQDAAATSLRTLTLSGSSPGQMTISAGIRDNNTAGGGTVSLVKAGPGRWILSGTNTYTGNTTISQGALEIATTAALPGWNTVGRFAVQPGATLTLRGTVGAANIDTMLGTGTSNFLPGSTVQIDTSTAALTLSAAVPSGINLAKAGANTLTLTGASSPASTTIAAGGTLEVGAGGTTGSLSGNVVNSGTLAFNRSDDVTFSGTVSGAGVLTKSGAGKLTLSANNTFTGAATINQGTLENVGIGDSNSTIFLSGSNDSGTFRYVGASNLVLANRQVQVGNVASGTGSAVILSDGAGTLSFTTAAFSNTFGGATAARTLVLGGTNTGGNTIAGTIANNSVTGTIGLSKQGSGTWILSGANTYTGLTSVEAGMLFVNGSLGSGDVSVASAAMLGGSGTIGGAVTVLGGGIVSPGNSPGTLTVNNAFTLADTSIMNFELNPADTTVGGVINDLITGVTNLTLDGVLEVSGAGTWTTIPDQTKWRLFNYTGTLTNNALTLGTTPTLGSGQSFEIDTSTVGQVNLIVVPEPSTFVMVAGIAAASIIACRRSRRRSA